MIQKYCFGEPFETDAVVVPVDEDAGTPDVGAISLSDGFSFSYTMVESDIVYGLGESNRGINKRGYLYVSECADDPDHTEDKVSLYGAHNFIIISGTRNIGLFFDYPGTIRFDIGYTRQNLLTVSCERADLALYVITGESAYDVTRQFRSIIGRSYIPPKYAFGFGQSRWGYRTAEDFRTVVKNTAKIICRWTCSISTSITWMPTRTSR